MLACMDASLKNVCTASLVSSTLLIISWVANRLPVYFKISNLHSYRSIHSLIFLLFPILLPNRINGQNLKYRIFRPITRALSIQKGYEIVKNEHARYTLERFPRALSVQKKVSENTVLCIKHNFQLKLVCSIHSVALLKSQGTVLQLTTDH